MISPRRRRDRRTERGAVLVEAAIITPIMALLLFAIIEFGILLKTSMNVTDASREGARAAASLAPTGAAWQASVLARVKDNLSNYPTSQVVSVIVYEADETNGYPLKTQLAGDSSATRPANSWGTPSAPLKQSTFTQLTTSTPVPSLCRYRCVYWTPASSGNWTTMKGDVAWGTGSTAIGQNVNACLPKSQSPATTPGATALPPIDKRSRVGVYIQLRYDPITPLIGNIVGNGRPVRDHAVVRIEPAAGAPQCV